MKDIKNLVFKVMSILFMSLSLATWIWMFGVNWLFKSGLEIGYVYLQLATMSFVATLFLILGQIFRFLEKRRSNVFEILQTFAMLVVSIMMTSNMITIAIAYYGKWWSMHWYPLW